MSPEESKIDSIVLSLRADIKSGVYGTNGRLPSIPRLVKTYEVSRTTIYQVLNLLQSEGLILSRDNGYVVYVPPMRLAGAPLFDKYMEKMGLKPEVDNIVEPEIVALPSDVAEMFGAQEGVHYIHRMRRHGATDVPYRLAENWYPVDLAGEYLQAMKEDPNLNVAGEIRKNKGVAIATRHDAIKARLPTPEEVKLLNLVRTSPVIEIRRSFLAKDGRVVLYSRQTLVAAYFELHYDSDHLKDKENENKN